MGHTERPTYLSTMGVMLTVNSKSCNFARFLCEKAGVQFILGEPHGKLKRLIIDHFDEHKRIIGIETSDGRAHVADLVVVAGTLALHYPIYKSCPASH